MSGFGFYISCRVCGLVSNSYPSIYETVFFPTTLVLPVIDRAQRMFDRLEIPVTKRFSEESLRTTAASFSDADRVVCVPRFNPQGDGYVLEPEARCPLCDGELGCPFGEPPMPQRTT